MALSFDDYMEIGRKVNEDTKKRKDREKKLRDDYLKSVGVNPNAQKHIQPKCDSVYSLENGPATILYAIIMIGSLIFNQFWIVWIVATIIYFNFITRDMGDKNNE